MILNEPLNVCLIGGKVFFLTNKGESVAILADKCKKECCIEKKAETDWSCHNCLYHEDLNDEVLVFANKNKQLLYKRLTLLVGGEENIK